MNLQARKNPFLTIAFAGSLLLHLAFFWLLGAIEQKIRIDLSGQQHINVRLAGTTLTQESAPAEEVSHSSVENLSITEQKVKQALKPLKQPSPVVAAQKSTAQQVQQIKTVQKKADPVITNSLTANQVLVSGRIPEHEKETEALTNEQSQPDEQLEPVNQTEVQETASIEEATEKKNETLIQAGSAESGSSSQAAAPIQRYQLGSKDNPEPEYPMLARKKGWQGDVILGVHLEADGSIKHLTFVKSTDYGILNHAAYETVRTQWRFEPLYGENIQENNYIEVPISFRFD